MHEQPVRYVETEVLRIAYLESGPSDGWPVILSHGFPYDVHAYDAVAPMLVEAGARVVTPYTRGFGPTRFVSDATMRSGQQAARGLDIIQFADALDLERPILGGYDWGGNASCVAAALWPERIGGLVSYAGYDVIDVGGQRPPSSRPSSASAGISTSFRRNAAASAWQNIVRLCAGYCGASGPLTGSSMKPPSPGLRPRTTIRISWTS